MLPNCAGLHINIWTKWPVFIKFSTSVTSLEAIPVAYFLIFYDQL